MITHILSENSTSKILKEEINPKDCQPNAIDLRLDQVFRVEPTMFALTEDNKVNRERVLIEPNVLEIYHLPKGVYEITFDSEVDIGSDEAGLIVPRSTLNRNGVFITSGLWDSGYNGVLGAALHNYGGPMLVKRGTRLAQLVIWKAESLFDYKGQYGRNEDGTAKEEEKRYHV
jgi:dUTP pyrophosphatase